MAHRWSSIGKNKPVIGSAYFMDKESDLLRIAKNREAAITGPYKAPPKWKQALLGLLIASTFILACFI
jgi:hypothetical protein